MEVDKRKLRREIDFLQRESVWLQKALFALRKADVAQQKVAETRGDDPPEKYLLEDGKRKFVLADLEDVLQARVDSLMKTIREARESLNP